MKNMPQLLRPSVVIWLLAGLAAWAQTPGAVTFNVRTVTTGSGYDPKHVLAIWVVDSSGNFVQTLAAYGGSRRTHLNRWQADTGAAGVEYSEHRVPTGSGNEYISESHVDGYTGATLSNHYTHDLHTRATVWWDCRNWQGDLVPDGDYTIRVEFTEQNGNGPYIGSLVNFTKGANPLDLTFPDQTNFKDISMTYAQAIDPVPNTLVGKTSTWRYAPAGVDLHGSGWEQIEHDDSGWTEQATILGYNNSGVTSPEIYTGGDPKPPVYYFRKTFAASAVPDALQLSVLRDDCAVVYLNGVELGRSNLDPGPTSYDYAGNTVSSGDETTYFGVPGVDPSLVAVGENVLAVELHQANATSSDTSFDLELKAGNPTVVAHDVALSGLLSDVVDIGSVKAISLSLSNLTPTLESVVVTVSNLTTGTEVAPPMPRTLEGNGGTQLPVWWDTTGLPESNYLLEARVTEIPGEAVISNNVTSASFNVRPLVHDVAVLHMAPRSAGIQGDLLSIDVDVANHGAFAETMTVTLTDTNTAQVIGATTVSALAPDDWQRVTFVWNTTGAATGSHTLEATISGVPADVTPGDQVTYTDAQIVGTGFGLEDVEIAGSLGGWCQAVTVDGSLAALGAGATLVLVDVATPGAPAELGRLRLPGTIEDVLISGTWIYAACGPAGVQIIDASNLAAPAHAGTFQGGGHAQSLAIRGSHLLAADGGTGIHILDVSTPATPGLAGVYRTAGPAHAVLAAAATSYVLDANHGLLVLDAALPNPSLQGTYNRVVHGLALDLASSTVFVTDGSGMFSALDVSGLPPTLAGSIRLGQYGRAVAVYGSHAYVATEDAGILVLDVTSPATPVEVNTNTWAHAASDLEVSGTHLYVADGPAGLKILSLASPTTPAPAGQLQLAAAAAHACAESNTAYVVSGEGGLRIFDITDVTTPLFLGSCTCISNGCGVAVSSGTVAVADGQFGVKLVDATTPASPTQLGVYPDLPFAGCVAMHGTTVLASDGTEVHLIDVSSPAAPAVLDTWAAPAFVHALALSSNRAGVAMGNAGVAAFDIRGATLGAPGIYDTSGYARGVKLNGQLAYVADSDRGWLMLDLANPAAPALVSSTPTARPAMDVASTAHLVAAGDGYRAGTGYDVTTPVTPVPRHTFQRLVQVLRLSADGPYVLASENEAGVAILDISPEDHDLDGMLDSFEMEIVNADPGDAIESIEDVLGDDDFDGDALSNYGEMIAGTSATDPGSVFAAVAPTVAAGSFTVRWHSVPGKVYSVYRSGSLTEEDFVLLEGGIPSAGALTSHEDTSPLAGDAFYLIKVEGP